MEICTISNKMMKGLIELILKAGRNRDAPLTFTPTGLVVQVMDPSHIAMIDLTFDESDFLSYGFGTDDLVMYLEIEAIKKRLAVLSTADIIISYVKKDRQFRMQSGRTTLDLPLLGDPPKLVQPNDIRDKMNRVEILSSDFQEGLLTAGLVHDLIKIRLDGPDMIVSASGDKTSSETLLKLMEPVTTPTCVSTFDNDYVCAAVKAIRTASPEANLTLYVAQDHPLIIDFSLGKTSHGSFTIAPRVGD